MLFFKGNLFCLFVLITSCIHAGCTESQDAETDNIVIETENSVLNVGQKVADGINKVIYYHYLLVLTF